MTGSTGYRRPGRIGLLAALAAAALLGGCKESELGRDLHLQKGVHGGPADTALSAETRVALKERVALQRGGQPELRQPPAPAAEPGAAADGVAVEGRIANQRF